MRVPLRLSLMIAALGKDKLRLILALGATAVGIASMLVMLALGTGARLEAQKIIDEVGTNLFLVRAKEVEALPSRGSGWYEAKVLKPEDPRILKDQIDSIVHVVPVFERGVLIELGRREINATLVGTTPAFPEVRNYRVEDGRFFDQAEEASRDRVAVVGSFVAEQLTDDDSLVGETVLLGNVPFEVIGQLAEKGSSSDGGNQDDKIFIPVSTALNRLYHGGSFTRLLVQVDDRSNMESAKRQVGEVLRDNRGIAPGAEVDFDILDMIANLRVRKVSNALINGMARFFAMVTLAIGGAGIFAVMILSVKERVGEIGLRRAVGASGKDIAWMFLFEAFVLSVSGGLVGLVSGWLGVLLLEAFTEWAMHVDLASVALPFATSVLLGLACGVLPSIQASRLEPVVALRSD